VRPHAGTLSVDACSFAGCGDVLTREASRHHVNTSAPRVSIEGLHVVPNREWLKASFVLAGHENASGVGVPLDCAEGFPSEDFASEYAASSTGEEREFSKS